MLPEFARVQRGTFPSRLQHKQRCNLWLEEDSFTWRSNQARLESEPSFFLYIHWHGSKGGNGKLERGAMRREKTRQEESTSAKCLDASRVAQEPH